MNIFAMQGVPRYLIDERILAGATNYWAKVKAEQSQKPKKEKEKKPNAKKEKASGKDKDENSMKNQGFSNTFIIFLYKKPRFLMFFGFFSNFSVKNRKKNPIFYYNFNVFYYRF